MWFLGVFSKRWLPSTHCFPKQRRSSNFVFFSAFATPFLWSANYLFLQEDKKAKVEKKLEEAAKKEREKIRLERQKLMDIRKQRESYIKAVENNMKLVKEVNILDKR